MGFASASDRKTIKLRNISFDMERPRECVRVVSTLSEDARERNREVARVSNESISPQCPRESRDIRSLREEKPALSAPLPSLPLVIYHSAFGVIVSVLSLALFSLSLDRIASERCHRLPLRYSILPK